MPIVCSRSEDYERVFNRRIGENTPKPQLKWVKISGCTRPQPCLPVPHHRLPTARAPYSRARRCSQVAKYRASPSPRVSPTATASTAGGFRSPIAQSALCAPYVRPASITPSRYCRQTPRSAACARPPHRLTAAWFDTTDNGTWTQRQTALTKMERQIVPYDANNAADVEAAKFVEAQLSRINFDHILKAMHWGVFYGLAEGHRHHRRHLRQAGRPRLPPDPGDH